MVGTTLDGLYRIPTTKPLPPTPQNGTSFGDGIFRSD